jgi:hypothetical protein
MKIFKTPASAAITLYLIGTVIIFGHIYFAGEHIKAGNFPMIGVSAFFVLYGIILVLYTFKIMRKHY